jgi:hypothetical protein
MPDDEPFAVFSQDGDGPMWRGVFDGLDVAKQRARKRVDDEGLEAFVFSFDSASEVARFFPKHGASRSI